MLLKNWVFSWLEAYLEPSPASMIKFFAKIINGFWSMFDRF